MTFTVRDYHDLVSLLYRYPEWRAELRELILSEDFLELPRSVQALIEAQKRTEESLKELIEVQKRADHRMDRLEASVQELAEAQRRTEQSVKELAQAQRRTHQALERLSERVGVTVEEGAGSVLEVGLI